MVQVLLFSYSVNMLSIVETVVVKKGYSFFSLDSNTPTASRQSLVGQFNQSPSTFLFLISTLAGEMGLNLTAAKKYVPGLFSADNVLGHFVNQNHDCAFPPAWLFLLPQAD